MLQQQQGGGGYGWGSDPIPKEALARIGPGCHAFNNSIIGSDLDPDGENPSGGSVKELCKAGHILFVETMNQECATFELVVSLILVGVTCMLGLAGNILSIMTLQRDNVQSVTTFLLTMLAVADIAFILPAIMVILVPNYCEYFQHCVLPLREVIPYIEQYGWAVASFSHSCTVYITVLVAIHRYFYVCRPHDCHRLSGLTRARRQAFLVPVCALLFNLPRIFEYKVHKLVITQEDNSTFLETVKVFTSTGETKVYQIFYKNVMFVVIMYVIPLTTLITLSIKLAQALHRRRKNKYRGRSSQSITHRRDDNITFVLIIIIAVFVVCQTPTLFQRLILALAGAQGHHCGHIYFYFEQTADYFAVLNSCINFVIYVLFARRFRHTLINDILCKYCRGRPNRQDSEKNSEKAMKEVQDSSDPPPKKAPLISIRISKKSTSHQATSSPDPKSCPGGLKLNNGNLIAPACLNPDSLGPITGSQPTSTALTSTSELEISAFEPEIPNTCTVQEQKRLDTMEAEEAGDPKTSPRGSGLGLADGQDEVVLQGNLPALVLDAGDVLESLSDPELDSPSESLLQADSSAFHASV